MKKLISFLLVGLFALTLLTSCKPSYPASPTYTIMTSEQLNLFLTITNKINAVANSSRIPDTLYAIPTVEWVKKDYTPHLQQFLFENQLRKSSEIENDCDKYATYGRTVGHIMHHHATKKPKGTALAIGEFDYMNRSFDAHAINFFIATDAFGELKVVFYEPQTQQIVELDPTNVLVLHWTL